MHYSPFNLTDWFLHDESVFPPDGLAVVHLASYMLPSHTIGSGGLGKNHLYI